MLQLPVGLYYNFESGGVAVDITLLSASPVNKTAHLMLRSVSVVCLATEDKI